MKKRYSREFKLQGLELVGQPGMTLTQAAKDLGVGQSQLYRWRRSLANNETSAFPGKGKLHAADGDVRQFRREVGRLRMERDILKRAAVFFAKEDTRD